MQRGAAMVSPCAPVNARALASGDDPWPAGTPIALWRGNGRRVGKTHRVAWADEGGYVGTYCGLLLPAWGRTLAATEQTTAVPLVPAAEVTCRRCR